jgi:hypothetical protein
MSTPNIPSQGEVQTLSEFRAERSRLVSRGVLPFVSIFLLVSWLAEFLQHYTIHYDNSLNILTMVVIPLFLCVFHFVVVAWCLWSFSNMAILRKYKISGHQIRRLSECMCISVMGCCLYIGIHLLRDKQGHRSKDQVNVILYTSVMGVGISSLHNLGIHEVFQTVFLILMTALTFVLIFCVAVSGASVLLNTKNILYRCYRLFHRRRTAWCSLPCFWAPSSISSTTRFKDLSWRKYIKS